MTQEDKELLLKDLSARLPYGVKINQGYDEDEIDPPTLLKVDIVHVNDHYPIESVKPYLRPMSSITEEEKEELENLLEGIVDGVERWDKPDMCEEYDWLNAHHFDYRGLIEKGLALEAPEGMYNGN